MFPCRLVPTHASQGANSFLGRKYPPWVLQSPKPPDSEPQGHSQPQAALSQHWVTANCGFGSRRRRSRSFHQQMPGPRWLLQHLHRGFVHPKQSLFPSLPLPPHPLRRAGVSDPYLPCPRVGNLLPTAVIGSASVSAPGWGEKLCGRSRAWL